jgi:hypothetical protein
VAKVEISVNSQFSAAKEIKSLRDDYAEILNREVQLAAGEIVKRAQSGITPDGGAMAPYSPAYAKRKVKTKRGANVNLTFSGQLLQAIQSKVEKVADGIVATIYFNAGRSNRSGSSITNPALAQAIEKKRKFFALSAQQIDKIINALQR